jgi:hypothetical protein
MRKPRRNTLKVGQTVLVRTGGRQLLGIIVEDRGPIGIGGRRLWRVRESVGVGDFIREFEVPADQLTAMPRRGTTGRATDRDRHPGAPA